MRSFHSLPILSAAAYITNSISSECRDGSAVISVDHISPSKDDFIISKQNDSLTIKYDSRTRNPRWVLERLKRQGSDGKSLESSSSKRPAFYRDRDITEPIFQVDPRDYKGCGYDRGHLAAAADFKHSAELSKATFAMSNVSPQNPKMNRGVWKALEQWTRDLLLDHDEVVVVSGPAFLPTHKDDGYVIETRTIGSPPHLVHVPTHFFKVVLTQKLSSKGEEVRAAAFLVPNCDPELYTHKRQMSPSMSIFSRIWEWFSSIFGISVVKNRKTNTLEIPLSLTPLSFLVRIETLEAVVGIKFFDSAALGHFVKHMDSCVEEKGNEVTTGLSLREETLLFGMPGPQSQLMDVVDISRTEVLSGPGNVKPSTFLAVGGKSEESRKLKSKVLYRHLCAADAGRTKNSKSDAPAGNVCSRRLV